MNWGNRLEFVWVKGDFLGSQHAPAWYRAWFFRSKPGVQSQNFCCSPFYNLSNIYRPMLAKKNSIYHMIRQLQLWESLPGFCSELILSLFWIIDEEGFEIGCFFWLFGSTFILVSSFCFSDLNYSYCFISFFSLFSYFSLFFIYIF